MPSWCGLFMKRLVISMVASMTFSGKWLMFWILLRESVVSCRKLAFLVTSAFRMVSMSLDSGSVRVLQLDMMDLLRLSPL